MQRISMVIVVGLGGSLVGACGAPKLRPEAASVQVVSESDKPLHCQTLGTITGKASADTEQAARDAAVIAFRNEAGKRNANYALITQENGGKVGTTGSSQVALVGKALKCTDSEAETSGDGGATTAP